MIPEKIQSFRKILERNNLITVLCLLLVLVSFILNYLERRETLGKQLEFSYYVATDGEVIPARYAQRRDNIEIEIRHHLAMFVDDWYALTQDTWEAKAEAAGWLGGNSIRDMYIARREAGFFNRFIQGNIRYGAVTIPENTLLAGYTQISENRLTININSVRLGNGVFALPLEVYGSDGIAGIPLDYDEVGKITNSESSSSMLQEASTAMSAYGGTIGRVVGSVVSGVGNQVRSAKSTEVKLIDNQTVILKIVEK